MVLNTIKILAAEHPIKSVTVFKSSKAEVVRTFSLDLKKEQNKVVITGLPRTIDTESVRVSGLGTRARLFDVVCTVQDRKNTNDDSSALSPAPDSPAEAIRVLTAKKHALECEKRMREHEADLLVNYAKTLNGEHVNPKDMGEFMTSFIERSRKNLGAVAELDEHIVSVNRQIQIAKKDGGVKEDGVNGQVTIVLNAEEDGAVEIKLSYIVSDAYWTPTYELHATTADGGKPSSSVSLHYRARINQSSGEDWTDTALTLSTVASDTIAKTLPAFKPVKIRTQPHYHNSPSLFGQQSQAAPQSRMRRQAQAAPAFGQPVTQQQQQSSSGLFGGAAFGSAPQASRAYFAPQVGEDKEEDDDDDDDGAFEEVPAPGPFSEPTTVVSESSLAISYSVDGKSSVPADGVAHQVSIAVLPFESKVTYVTIPKTEACVYLQCAVKNTSEYRLLPGPVGVFLNDSFVSKTSIHDINTGDTFDCTLGTDHSTLVTYARTSRTARASSGGAFAEVSNTTTYTAITTIRNKHRFALQDLIVREGVPLADEKDKHIKVILRKPVGLADAKDGDEVDVDSGGKVKARWGSAVDGKGGEKEGRFEWVGTVEAGKEVKLVAEWEIKAPADVSWFETY